MTSCGIFPRCATGRPWVRAHSRIWLGFARCASCAGGYAGGVHVGGEQIMEMPRIIRGEIDKVILTVYAEANDF